MGVTIQFIEANKMIIEQFEYFFFFFENSCTVRVCESVRDKRIESTVMKVDRI